MRRDNRPSTPTAPFTRGRCAARTRDARPYGAVCYRRHSVGPHQPLVGPFAAAAQDAQAGGRLLAAPTVKLRLKCVCRKSSGVWARRAAMQAAPTAELRLGAFSASPQASRPGGRPCRPPLRCEIAARCVFRKSSGGRPYRPPLRRRWGRLGPTYGECVGADSKQALRRAPEGLVVYGAVWAGPALTARCCRGSSGSAPLRRGWRCRWGPACRRPCR